MLKDLCNKLQCFADDIIADINNFDSKSQTGIFFDAMYRNKWFTLDNIFFALRQLATSLEKNKTEKWLNKYEFSKHEQKNIALILAGNIPAVGFHDIICTLISGNKAIIKTSSKDDTLIKYLCEKLKKHFPEWAENIIYNEHIFKDFDAVIATGSNNSGRYFEKYFSKVPNIIRHHRNSIAILTGNESDEDLKKLQSDIFTYFGLGCRNVSMIFFPENYDLKKFISAMNIDNELMQHNAYNNNYAYYKAYFALMDECIIDCEKFLLRENNSPASPISVIHFTFYKNADEVREFVNTNSENIQCICGTMEGIDTIPFGKAQQPEIDEYADNIDTIKFLLSIQ